MNRNAIFFIIGVLCLCALFDNNANGQSNKELSVADSDLFEIHVRPFFTAHCIGCHGDAKQEGGLKLTTLNEMKVGGESGPAIVPGNANDSLLVAAVRHESLEMPPDEQLEKKWIDGVAKWIDAGAPWPTGTVLRPTRNISDDDRQWWSYQPIVDHQPPAADDPWCKNDIDKFIFARLGDEGMKPSQPANRTALIRRLCFSLTGLPPTAEVIEKAASTDYTIQTLVDDLLQSDRYGENQAKFWLDLVRYADTDGYRADHSRPEAKHYRDYVIRSFNADKPYDQFVREQLAGDEIDPGKRDAHIATMYLRHWIYEHNQRDVETQWQEILDDITETTSDVFLAQGLKCAKCHDHKFDPLLQKDYFRLKAFFAAFQPSENHPVATAQARAAYQSKLKRWESATDDLRKRLREIEHPVLLEHATREGFDKFIPKIKAMVRKRQSERDPYENQIASLAERQFDLPYEKLNEWLTQQQQKERDELLAKLAEFDDIKPKPLPTIKFVASDIGPVAPATYIPDLPDHAPIDPGFITLLDPSIAMIQPPEDSLQSTGRRTALANWIVDRSNPLTARVIVNRIWQQHFGVGLVETSSDFGQLGVPPTHPKLLDWLATRFVDDGWSIKKLHRRIMLSATYQQSSQRPQNEKTKTSDPTNRLLWRMNARRLSGEEIYDAIIAASGELAEGKRAIHQVVKRNKPDPILAAFDSPDRIRSVGNRHRTTTSPQALLMENGSWTHERAEKIAARFKNDSDDALLSQVYLSLFGREPNADESASAAAFLDSYVQATPDEKPPVVKTLAVMPKTKNGAIDLTPGGPTRVKLPASDDFPNDDFSVKAVVLLRSLYKDASVRTVVANWSGNNSRNGWSLGVTSTKSAYKPRNLILQLIGKTNEGSKIQYEVVASNLRPELNKPYMVGVSVDLSDTTESGITFYLQDLTDPKAKIQTANATHKVTSAIRAKEDLTIGDRHGKHQWDGLIDQVAIESKPRDLSVVAQADSADGLPQYLVDWQFEDSEKIGRDYSGNNHHAKATFTKPKYKTPGERARTALVHALLNCNELIYVD